MKSSSSNNFQTLSLSDLLEARAQYHVHLTCKANVVGTAVGLFLMRQQNETSADPGPRTFSNSEVRKESWPCVLVMVDKWVDRKDFSQGKHDLHDLVPTTLYMPDGRCVPVCVVKVDRAAPGQQFETWAPTQASLGSSSRLAVTVQNRTRYATAGCLVTDGRLTYVLTNRHVAGIAGQRIAAVQGGTSKEIGTTVIGSIAKQDFSLTYPLLPSDRALVNIDSGLIEVDDADDWHPDNYGLGVVGELYDLNEYNIGTDLIDQELVAFGAVSGKLKGKVKALFYRYASVGGYDYVSDFLIQPNDDKCQAHPGDSGSVWHVETIVKNDKGKDKTVYRPLAMEWGGQGVHGQESRITNFSLATSLSTVFKALEVDLITSDSIDAAPFWGAMGHYAIGYLATTLVTNPSLKKLLTTNALALSPNLDNIETANYTKDDFVPLNDVPDLVWKHVPPTKECNKRKGLAGGRDFACNTGPEHPNHFADVDIVEDGTTFLAKCLKDKSLITEHAWLDYYRRNGHTAPADQGCLPFRCKQIFNEMLDSLNKKDLLRFVTAAGVLAHYVGDACQPLHCSQFADGVKTKDVVLNDLNKPKSWYGKGVHSCYEDGMVELNPKKLFDDVQSKASRLSSSLPATGQDAAIRCVELMGFAFGQIAPMDLVDTYHQLGGGTSQPVKQGLFDKFEKPTAAVMAEGAKALAELWQGAWIAANGPKQVSNIKKFDLADIKKLYENTNFVKSMYLKDMIAPGGGSRSAATTHTNGNSNKALRAVVTAPGRHKRPTLKR